jgi:hypothetical protein
MVTWLNGYMAEWLNHEILIITLNDNNLTIKQLSHFIIY